eukprot:COSAG05_NODE_1253_length_5369_cov_14.480674_3_plen_84_part_00
MAKRTIALSQSLGCLLWSAGLLVAGCLPRLLGGSRLRLGSASSGRVSTHNCITLSFKQEAGYLVEQELLVFFNPTLPHLGGVQ